MTKYNDPALEADRLRGMNDAIAGRKSTTRTAASVSAYTTGYEEGWEERRKAINSKRMVALRKAREVRATGKGREA